jgi:GNAT superfamily N-acetyltransferase
LNNLEITAINSSNISDRLWLCWGHLDDWKKLPIVKKSEEWLEKVNAIFAPTTFLAYSYGKPVGMIEFMPQKLLKQLGLCPCRIDIEHGETESHYTLGEEFDNYLFISCLSVAKDHQRKGVGKTLLNHLLGSQVLQKYDGAMVYARERDQNWEKFIHWPAGPSEFYLKADFFTAKTFEEPVGHILFYEKR